MKLGAEVLYPRSPISIDSCTKISSNTGSTDRLLSINYNMGNVAQVYIHTHSKGIMETKQILTCVRIEEKHIRISKLKRRFRKSGGIVI